MVTIKGTGSTPVGSKVTAEEHETLRVMAFEQRTTISAIVAQFIREGLARAREQATP